MKDLPRNKEVVSLGGSFASPVAFDPVPGGRLLKGRQQDAELLVGGLLNHPHRTMFANHYFLMGDALPPPHPFEAAEEVHGRRCLRGVMTKSMWRSMTGSSTPGGSQEPYQGGCPSRALAR